VKFALLLLTALLLGPSTARAANVAFVDWTSGGQNSRSTTSTITKVTTTGNTGVVQVWECAKGDATAVVPTVSGNVTGAYTQRAVINQTIAWGTLGAYLRCYVFTTAAGGIVADATTTCTWSSAIPGVALAGLYQVSGCIALGGISTNSVTDATSINANIPMTCENNNLILAMLNVWDVGSNISTRTGTASIAAWMIMNNNWRNDEMWVDNERQTIATQGAATVGYTFTKAVPLAEMITMEFRNGSSANTLTPTNTPTYTNTITATPTYTAVSTNTNQPTNTLQATNTFIATNTAVATNTVIDLPVLKDSARFIPRPHWWAALDFARQAEAAIVVARPTDTPLPGFTPGASPGSVYVAADGLRFLVLYPGEPVPEGYRIYSRTRSPTRTSTPTRTCTRTATPTP